MPSLLMLPLLILIYLFICDVYTGNPIQQRWFKRRPENDDDGISLLTPYPELNFNNPVMKNS